MEINDYYSKNFKKVKRVILALFVIGCLMNPVLDELAFLLVGVAVGAFVVISRIEKVVKKNIFLATEAKITGDELSISVQEKDMKLVLNKDSKALQKCKYNGEDIIVFSPGTVVCVIESDM
jgi:hypothetical protein